MLNQRHLLGIRGDAGMPRALVREHDRAEARAGLQRAHAWLHVLIEKLQGRIIHARAGIGNAMIAMDDRRVGENILKIQADVSFRL